MDLTSLNIWYWIILILIALICLYIGYLTGKGKQNGVEHSTNIKSLQDKNAKLRADLERCNNALMSTMASTPKNVMAPSSSSSAFDTAAAKAALGKNVREDDLKIIEGIGPKIEEMFKEAGISTWKLLSETAVAQCHDILKSGGERYKIHDPASWPMQAKMCSENKWAELARWQDEHDYGKL